MKLGSGLAVISILVIVIFLHHGGVNGMFFILLLSRVWIGILILCDSNGDGCQYEYHADSGILRNTCVFSRTGIADIPLCK